MYIQKTIKNRKIPKIVNLVFLLKENLNLVDHSYLLYRIKKYYSNII